MKKGIRKKFLGVFLSVVMFAEIFSPQAADANETQSAEWQTCTVYEGENIESQNYARWANSINSYLTVCGDDKLMRVQSCSMDDILVEYYDMSYHLLSTKLISSELPIFGGFYETDRYYFLLTGQENPDESDSVEVYRITKYDKEWNKISSAGLSNCNTTVPFDAGCARMDVAGNYLLIHTSHEMYQASDGRNHQANVMIQLDMESMRITDSFTGVMNSAYGYVSHSFNQFIKVEDNHIITVDHGDAYPRSVVLIKYITDITTGKFMPNYNNTCAVTDVLAFPGEIGHNTTGASIGGFEITDSSYLIAGNSVIQDDDNLTRTTRNIFVAAVDKNTNEISMNRLTNYEEGDGTTSTPQLVKTGDDGYIVLWSRDHTVYYTKINQNGERVDEIYEMAGNLSDCVPVAANGKLVWYTWKNAKITFYEIDLTDLSKNGMRQFENGHMFEAQGEVTDGSVELKCGHCGLAEQIKVVTEMSIFWNEDLGDGYYYSRFNPQKKQGEKLYYWIHSVSPEDADNKEVEVLVEDPTIMRWDETSGTMGYFTMLRPGKTTITFRPKYNPQAAYSYECEVQGDGETPSKPQSVMSVSHGLETVGRIDLPANWKWSDDDKDKILSAGETITAVAEYTGEDTLEPVEITITADEHEGGIATCSKEAVCEICHKSYGEKDLSNHDISPVYRWSNDYKKCTADFICSFGNETVASRECEIYPAVTQIATCINAEKTVYTAFCRYDGSRYEDMKEAETKPALGHNYVNGICSRCGNKQGTGTGENNSVSNPKPSVGDIIQDKETGASYKITKSDAKGAAVSYIRADKKAVAVVIPDTTTIDGVVYKVTCIGQNAFKGCTKLKAVTIGKNVSKIEKRAFYKAKKLRTVIFRTTKLTGKKVGKQAFKGIHSKAVIKVPSKKLKSYRKILKARGITGKRQKIKK